MEQPSRAISTTLLRQFQLNRDLFKLAGDLGGALIVLGYRRAVVHAGVNGLICPLRKAPADIRGAGQSVGILYTRKKYLP